MGRNVHFVAGARLRFLPTGGIYLLIEDPEVREFNYGVYLSGFALVEKSGKVFRFWNYEVELFDWIEP